MDIAHYAVAGSGGTAIGSVKAKHAPREGVAWPIDTRLFFATPVTRQHTRARDRAESEHSGCAEEARACLSPPGVLG
jgi:hypothetical protein